MDRNVVYGAVDALVQYGLDRELIGKTDEIYTRNRLLEALGLEEYEPQGPGEKGELEEILGILLDYAGEQGMLKGDSVVCRDLFDTKLMDCLMPRPSQVEAEFWQRYKEDPRKATDWYYQFSQDSRLYPPLPYQKRHEMDGGYPLRKPGCDH